MASACSRVTPMANATPVPFFGCEKSRWSARATSAASHPSQMPSGTMSPTRRLWRSISWLVVPATASDVEKRSSRLMGLAIRSANPFTFAVRRLISNWRSYEGRRQGAA